MRTRPRISLRLWGRLAVLAVAAALLAPMLASPAAARPSSMSDGRDLSHLRPGRVDDLAALAGHEQVKLSWSRPFGPAVESYQLRRKTGNGPWGAWADIAGSSGSTRHHTVTGLTNGTTYTFQVRAKNVWSRLDEKATAHASNEAVVTPALNRAPVFTEGTAAARTMPADIADLAEVGKPISATDPDGDTLTYQLGWGTPDVEHWTIDESTGQISTAPWASAVRAYSGPQDSYTFPIHVYDGKAGGTDTITVTITVVTPGQQTRSAVSNERPTSSAATPTQEAAVKPVAEATSKPVPVVPSEPEPVVPSEPAPVAEATSEPAPGSLTAIWAPPKSHDGAAFTFRLSFSENVRLSFRDLRDLIIQADGGDVTRSRRTVKGSNQNWDVTVVPDGTGDITLRLAVNGACGTKTAVCTPDGDKQLTDALSAVVSRQ